jgi:hypothetical protein
VKLALNRSEAVSQAIHAEAAEGYASVCSLIASMAALRGDLQVALTWINKALVVVPNNQSAKHDRATFQVLARGASSGVTRQSRKDLVSTEEGWERHHRRGEVR